MTETARTELKSLRRSALLLKTILKQLRMIDNHWTLGLWSNPRRRIQLASQLWNRMQAGTLDRLALVMLGRGGEELLRFEVNLREPSLQLGKRLRVDRSEVQSVQLLANAPRPTAPAKSCPLKSSPADPGRSRLRITRTGNRGYAFAEELSGQRRKNIFCHVSEADGDCSFQAGQVITARIVNQHAGVQAREIRLQPV